MKFRNVLAATAAVSLAAAPAIANAETAERNAAPAVSGAQFGGSDDDGAAAAASDDIGSGGIWMAILAAAAIIAGIVILAGNDDDTPASP